LARSRNPYVDLLGHPVEGEGEVGRLGGHEEGGGGVDSVPNLVVSWHGETSFEGWRLWWLHPTRGGFTLPAKLVVCVSQPTTFDSIPTIFDNTSVNLRCWFGS
jgi:hypothetical protein